MILLLLCFVFACFLEIISMAWNGYDLRFSLVPGNHLVFCTFYILSMFVLTPTGFPICWKFFMALFIFSLIITEVFSLSKCSFILQPN
jgi:hypothetical protein